ncbi:MAG: hypothetical protein GX575_18210 [Candidatus Anammoximicrobium sp.]|mgnify:CR=1 FL=1|nr:hypothetical protein [Candidatus Anammoximicrobium sp.]
MTTIGKFAAAVLLGLAGAAPVCAEAVWLRIDNVPENGLVVAEVDLTAAAQWCGVASVTPAGIRAVADSGATLQFVPDADFDPQKNVRGVLVARLPGGAPARLRLELDTGAAAPVSGDGVVETAGFRIVHDPARQGGLPSQLVFRATGKTWETIRWQDRLHHAQHGGYRIADDRQAVVTRIADGPLAAAVRVASRFVRGDGSAPESKPDAIYQWLYLRDRPLVYVTVVQRQQQPYAWNEAHFLECHQSGDELPQWSGGNPARSGEFSGADRSQPFRDWAALHDGRNAVAVLRSGQMTIYDGKGGYGPYLHAHSSLAWQAWSGTQRRLAAWLWIGSDERAAQAVAQAAEQLPQGADVTVTVERVQTRLEQARAEAAQRTGDALRQARRQVAVAERLERQGRFQAALDAADGKLPPTLQMLSAGDLGLLLERTPKGIRVVQLLDAASGVQLFAPQPLPLFSLALRRSGAQDDTLVAADDGWREARIERRDEGPLRLVWSGSQSDGLDALRVEAAAAPDEAGSAIRWTLRVETPADWQLREVTFPQVAVADLGRQADVVFPRGSGEIQRGLWQRAFTCSGRYPSGWTSMQWLAAYDTARQTGLYVAMHDPGAATKQIQLDSRPAERAVAFAFEHPPAGLGQPGGAFVLPGEAVWQLLRGDWFDAAQIYRQWASRNAKWWPELGPDGRADTPLWMRELPAWALASGKPESVVPQVKRFAEALGVSVGVHWYNWHQIPFDNDYPHYFPTHDGFKEAVAELQRGSVYVMPYINGRLWDTRDRGQEDAEFTKVAKAAATKNEQGEPYVETYGSKEPDGSPVRLAAMCPTTEVWRNKVREIVGRLTNECGVKAVYIDQVAAASPPLCMDRSHGHPTGGGDWWTAGYWELLHRIHRDLPPDRMLTTECNAEPYTHVFDGYLTWHWQYDGQVPAFPAVYGGAVQMFGRAYRGGETKDLALRMKAGQQLVFGEQIGWLSPSVVNEAENFAFFRQVVRLRWLLKRYFYAGQMARPPKLIGPIPRVTADWQWSGRWPVTTDALLAGAWSLPADKRLVLLFVNVSDQPLTVACDFTADQYALPGETFAAVELTSEGEGQKWTAPRTFRRDVSLPPHTARAWQLSGE